MSEISVSSTLESNALVSTVTVPKGLRKYFNSFRLFVSYASPLRADMSILNIPLVSTVLPLAWLTGTDVHVEKLDRKYVEAMDAIKHEFNITFPRGRFTTKLIVDDLVENKTLARGTALLFSGGVDSTYSLIKNLGLKPKLIMFEGVVGYQMDPEYEQHNLLVEKTYSDFARREGLEINFVETNAIGILDDGRISHDFHKILRGFRLWESLQLPLVLLGLAAPLSIGRFNRLLIAADEDPTSESDEYPYASRPRIIDQFVWADLKIILDGYVDRFSKTRLIKEYLKENKYHLKVCNDPPQDLLNCCTCEKCSRTIAPLVLEGIDPNTCGFTVNRPTFELMMQSLEKKKFEGWTSGWWKQMQDLIPCEMETDRFGSKDFLVWLKSLNIDKVRKDSKLHRDLFSLFPYPLAVLFEALYSSAYNHSFVRSVNTLLKSSVHALRRLIKAN